MLSRTSTIASGSPARVSMTSTSDGSLSAAPLDCSRISTMDFPT
jgi:hypothetical protein